MQVLLVDSNPKSTIEVGKVHAVAKLIGQSLATQTVGSIEPNLPLPCLRTGTEHHSGGNVIAKLLVSVLGHSLYPQPPYSSDKRHQAAQIDAWIDYSALQLQQVSVTSIHGCLLLIGAMLLPSLERGFKHRTHCKHTSLWLLLSYSGNLFKSVKNCMHHDPHRAAFLSAGRNVP